MERLTFEGNFCDIAQCRELPWPCSESCSQKQVWERLKTYEDTGLAPEGCAKMKRIDDLAKEIGITPERIAELITADKDDRVVILPCKVGTKVYRIRYKIADYPDDPELEIADTWFTPEYREDIGKTVFLTREEAEKALQEMEGKS